jgi:hypothetical protein
MRVLSKHGGLLFLLHLSGTVGQCSNTCNYASDGDCDDGGPGLWNSVDIAQPLPRDAHPHPNLLHRLHIQRLGADWRRMFDLQLLHIKSQRVLLARLKCTDPLPRRVRSMFLIAQPPSAPSAPSASSAHAAQPQPAQPHAWHSGTNLL